MLEVEPDKRPDIFQVSSLAYLLAGKSLPVRNVNVSECTPLIDLISPLINDSSVSLVNLPAVELTRTNHGRSDKTN